MQLPTSSKTAKNISLTVEAEDEKKREEPAKPKWVVSSFVEVNDDASSKAEVKQEEKEDQIVKQEPKQVEEEKQNDEVTIKTEKLEHNENDETKKKSKSITFKKRNHNAANTRERLQDV